MSISFLAVYENGLLRPLQPLDLRENERVTVIVTSDPQPMDSEASPGLPEPALSEEEFERLLAELASGPTLPHLPADFSRADVYTDHP